MTVQYESEFFQLEVIFHQTWLTQFRNHKKIEIQPISTIWTTRNRLADYSQESHDDLIFERG